jgi:hypothetical protein
MTRYGFGSSTKGLVRHRGVRRIIFPLFQPPSAMTISLVKPALSAMVAP